MGTFFATFREHHEPPEISPASAPLSSTPRKPMLSGPGHAEARVAVRRFQAEKAKLIARALRFFLALWKGASSA